MHVASTPGFGLGLPPGNRVAEGTAFAGVFIGHFLAFLFPISGEDYGLLI
jgi:hypothetical protein